MRDFIQSEAALDVKVEQTVNDLVLQCNQDLQAAYSEARKKSVNEFDEHTRIFGYKWHEKLKKEIRIKTYRVILNIYGCRVYFLINN